jgi:hypothetical protein
MNQRKRPNTTWVVEWKQVYDCDRDQRLQRAFAIILPQVEAKARRHTGEKHDVSPSRPLRQSVQ